MPVADDIPLGWTLPTLVALAFLVFGPPWIAVALGASWFAVAAGAVVWLVSVGVKRVVFGAMGPLWSRSSDAAVATIQGLLSAALELGASLAWFSAVATPQWIDAVGFGAGAGSCEVIYVLAMGSFVQPDNDDLIEWIRGAAVSLCVRFMVPIERLSASLGHLGSRGVMWVVAMYGGAAAPWGLASLAIFALIDGVAVYGHRRKWRWSDPGTCRRAHGSFMVLAVVEVGLFGMAARSVS